MTGSAGGEPPPEGGGAVTYQGQVRWEYRPEADGEPDPGEVVWAWVSYEEDARVGKDRPLIVVGHTHDDRLAALMLSSRDHSDDSRWFALGTGAWDRDHRASWARLDRLLAVSPGAVRREGAALSPEAFAAVARRAGASAARAHDPGSRPSRLALLRQMPRRIATRAQQALSRGGGTRP